MSDVEVAFHERWLGMAEPIEGLVVSVPVLVEAQCAARRDAGLSRRLADDALRLTRAIGKTPDGQERRELVCSDEAHLADSGMSSPRTLPRSRRCSTLRRTDR